MSDQPWVFCPFCGLRLESCDCEARADYAHRLLGSDDDGLRLRLRQGAEVIADVVLANRDAKCPACGRTDGMVLTLVYAPDGTATPGRVTCKFCTEHTAASWFDKHASVDQRWAKGTRDLCLRAYEDGQRDGSLAPGGSPSA